MKWKLAIILSLAAVFAAAGLIYFLPAGGASPKQLLKNLPGRTVDQKSPQLDRPNFIPNSGIDDIVDAYPYHILEGVLSADGGTDPKNWTFSTIDGQTLKLAGSGFQTAGFWVRRPDRTVKHLPPEELKDQDYIYVAYFAAAGSIPETKVISGVVNASRVDNDNLFIRLLDDLDNLEYQITPQTFFQIEDPSGLFTFVGESYLDIEPGELVKLSIDQTGKVSALTSVAPKVAAVQGKTRIIYQEEPGKYVQIGDFQVPIIIDERTIISSPNQPDKKFTYADIKNDMEVTAVFYNDADWLAAKTVEIRSP